MHGALPRALWCQTTVSEAIVYAIVETGGKQYRVQEGDILKLDRLKGTQGDSIELGRVLLVGGETTMIGSPVVAGAVINAKILEHKRDKKKIIFRYKSKKRYRVKKGHRQPITLVQVESILPLGKQADEASSNNEQVGVFGLNSEEIEKPALDNNNETETNHGT